MEFTFDEVVDQHRLLVHQESVEVGYGQEQRPTILDAFDHHCIRWEENKM